MSFTPDPPHPDLIIAAADTLRRFLARTNRVDPRYEEVTKLAVAFLECDADDSEDASADLEAARFDSEDDEFDKRIELFAYGGHQGLMAILLDDMSAISFVDDQWVISDTTGPSTRA